MCGHPRVQNVTRIPKKPFIQEMSSTDLQRYKDRELGIVHRRRHPMGKEASTVLALARGVM